MIKKIEERLAQCKHSGRVSHEKEVRYSKLFECCPESMVLLDRNGNILDLSGRFCKWLGSRRKEFIGKKFLELPFLPIKSKNKMYKKFNQRIAGKKVPPYELDFVDSNGEKRMGYVVTATVNDKQGEIVQCLNIISDISEKKETEKKLKKALLDLEATNRNLEEAIERSNLMIVEAEVARLELNQILNTASDGICVIDRYFRIVRCNKVFLTLFNIHQKEVINKKCYELIDWSLCQTPDCPLIRAQKSAGKVECDIEKKFQNGGKTPFLLSAVPFRGLDGETIGIVVNIKDITERKIAEMTLQKANQELQSLASKDSLTQIANRRKFDDYLKREWSRLKREQKPLSLIMCDIDYFKFYNDTYGHQSGDDCLCEVARLISLNVTRPADLVARYGGEEFAVILPDTPEYGALHVAENIRREIQGLKIAHDKGEFYFKVHHIR